MNRLLSIEFSNSNDVSKFVSELNKSIAHQNRIYFKVFTPKAKGLKHKIFYVADEGSEVIKVLEKHFNFINCNQPDRK